MQEWISFAVESWNSLKTRMLDKSTTKKENRMCKIAIRNTGMKQDHIARVLNVSQSAVSRLLKEHRESGSIRKRKGSTLVLECKELSLKQYGKWSIIWRPHDTVKGGYCPLNSQKYQDEILEYGVRLPLDSLDGQNMLLRDGIARPHCTRIIEEYKNQQNITSLPRLSLLPDLNPIEHVWDKLADVF